MEEQVDIQKRKKSSGVFLRILIFLLFLAAICTLLYITLTGLSPKDLLNEDVSSLWQRIVFSYSEDMPQKQLTLSLSEDDSIPELAVQGEVLVVCTPGEVKAFNSDGSERWTIPVRLSVPYITSIGRDVLYADLDGKSFGMIRDGSLFFEKQSENRIYHASLSRDFILLLTKGDETGYTSIMEGYSREGNPVFTSHFTDYTPFAVFHHPESGQKNLIISGISISSLKTNAAIEFITPDMTRLGGIQAEDDLYAIILQLSNGSTAFIGEREMKIVDKDFVTVGSYTSEGNIITAAALESSIDPVLAIFDQKRYETMRQEKTWLRTLSADGVLKRETVIEGRVNRLVAGKDILGIIQDKSVTFIDLAGNFIQTYETGSMINDIKITPNGLAYILADNQIISLRIREKKVLFQSRD